MKIAIAGAGGLGSFFCQFLYDFGVNRNQFPLAEWQITVFDEDTVDDSNCLHQNYSIEDIGQNKAQLMSDRYMFTAEPRFMKEEDFSNFDVVICCVDNIDFRKKLYEFGWSNKGIYWIDGRCSSRNIAVMNSKLPESVLKPMLESTPGEASGPRGCLRAVDKSKKKSHITPVIVAATMLQEFLNHLRDEDTASKIMLHI